MKLLAIINPFAAGGKVLGKLPKLKDTVAKTSHDFVWKITQSPDEMKSAIAGARELGVVGIILIGGDGTVSYALPALLRSGLPLGVIPCGRGNDFVRNLNLPLNMNDGILYPEQPKMRTIDIPTANGIPYASVACIGFDARVSELANSPHKYLSGRSVYIYSVLRTLRNFSPFRAGISNERNVWNGSIMMAAVANGCCYGGGMKIAPQADMEDGLLNICIVRKTSKWNLIKEFPKVFKGKHTGHPDVMTFTGRTITIISEEEQKVYADGENICRLPLTCSITNNQLNILQPIYNS